MKYDINVITKENQITKRWSGGTTTEICIFPKDSNYEDRNFIWRISSANVESEESNFTYLKNIWREIMILDGNIKLIHNDETSINLGKFEKHSFSGQWETRSYGKVTDFNLMVSEKANGNISYIRLNEHTMSEFSLNIKNKRNHKNLSYGFYCYEGNIKVCLDNKSFTLNKNDFFLINLKKGFGSMSLINESDNIAHIVKVKIVYN
ncbi:HutD family protein [Clostridium algidicarnis]|uniref:HutD family protein n=1 Tax=Clostridium algidicarnis TaxID=37659 RepID=UPI00049811EB|nr:HutD family protein [Clostridium algidicarnis]